MRLIHDDVTIGTGAQAIRLCPSLRAGMRLNRDWGIGRLYDGIHRQSISIMAALIEATADDPEKARDRLFRMIEREGVIALAKVQPALFDLLGACFGVDRDADPDDDHPAEKPGKPHDFEGYFEKLFEIGTGWLEWSPTETYAATPAEILIAQRGKLELLRAFNGVADKDGEEGSTFTKNAKPEDGDIPLEQVREGLATLRARLGA